METPGHDRREDDTEGRGATTTRFGLVAGRRLHRRGDPP